MPDRRFNKVKKLKYYGTDIWGTVFRSTSRNVKLRRTLRHLTTGWRLTNDWPESFETTGYNLSEEEKLKFSSFGGSRAKFQKQIAFYEYRLFKNFYSSLSDKEFKKAWAIARKSPNWHDALVQQLEGRAEYLVYRSGILRSVYAARALLRAGTIQAFRGTERIGTKSKLRLVLKPGDRIHFYFKSLGAYQQEAWNIARLHSKFQQIALRYPPSYMLIDYIGLSIGLTDKITFDQIRYPFSLPGPDFSERLKSSLDAMYYKFKKRYRYETLDDQFSPTLKSFKPEFKDPAHQVSEAKRFTLNVKRKSLFPILPENVYQKLNPSPVFVLPFHTFPNLGGSKKHAYWYPNATKFTSKLSASLDSKPQITQIRRMSTFKQTPQIFKGLKFLKL
eukprot:TRINITY_DN796_c0_g1_i1.p1 TRINITY_DN796_c0_g1~~TRINITY_DN796_c0_g1_i1.p1  ORF type:complete len:389 (+),score=60.95 TRINITY_DN796_c0_g1_i1:205-1371(+)